MSSPPLDFPSDDGSQNGTPRSTRSSRPQQTPSRAPRQQLFSPGTPSAAGTPGGSRGGSQPQQTPSRHGVDPLFLEGTPSAAGTPAGSVVARRNLGLESRTPRRTPQAARSSSPVNYSSPTKTPVRRPPASRVQGLNFNGPSSDAGSEPLEFPSSPAVPSRTRAIGSRRGDIHPTVDMSPARLNALQSPRRDAGSRIAPSSDNPFMETDQPQLTEAAEPTDEPDEIRAIWGTTINIFESMKLFREFLRGFKRKYRVAHDRALGLPTRPFSSPEEGEEVLYETYMRRMRQTGETNLNLDIVNLLAFPPTKKLHGHIIKWPQEIIPLMDQMLKEHMEEVTQADLLSGRDGYSETDAQNDLADIGALVYKVRPFGMTSVNMRNLNPGDTDKLVCIKGLVIRATPVIPDMKQAFFRCSNCNHTVQVDIDRGKIDEPSACTAEACQAVGTMSLIHNRCEYADRQVIRLQETPDAVPDGQTPHTVTLSVYDELVDVSKPGDRLIVTGVFRSVPVRVNPRQRTIKSLFRTYLDVVHLRIGHDDRLGFDKSTRPTLGDRMPGVGGVGGFDEEEERDGHGTRREELEARLVELSQRPDVYDLLSRSLAPGVWSMDDVKKGILLQLFGGTNKSIARGGGGGGPRYRGDINVLLVGDPGTAKSQILHHVHKLAPRGVYTSGKGSSAVGLTAYVTRDPDTKQLVLESGALVLSDGGVCCIDEFDKMSEATRSVLHEVMEQQTVSIAKAGIITTLNARTSILAAANPVGSRYDVNMPVTRNIDLPPTLISRFDLLYLVLDHVDEAEDRRLAQHLVGLYLEDMPETGGEDVLPLKELSAYITYARSRIHPTITEEAGEELVKCYVKLRSVGADPRAAEKRITATTRQLESMIRLSEAHARMRFSQTVELEDVLESYRLMRDAIRTSALDPTTGKIDMGMLNTGTGAQQRRLRDDMRKALLDMLASGGTRGVRWADAVTQLANQSSINVDANEFKQVITALENEGLVKVVGERDRRTIRRVEGA